MRMLLGNLAAIWRYPTKSLAAEPLTHAVITPGGIPGDRATQLVVRDGHARAGKAYRGKEDNLLHLTSSVDEARSIAAGRGVTVEAASGEGHYFDAAPLSLILDTWLKGVSEHVGFDVEHERYRPNFFIRAADGIVLTEHALVGRELRLGEVTLKVRKPIGRCVTTTYDQRTGESTPEILRYVAQERANEMGIYCDVLRAGTVRIGDSLELLER